MVEQGWYPLWYASFWFDGQDPPGIGVGHDYRAIQPAQRAHRRIAGDHIVPFDEISLSGHGVVRHSPRPRPRRGFP